MISPSIFKAYDIRGIYPKDIDETNIVQIIKGLYQFLLQDVGKKTLTVVLSRDMRLSSPVLSQSVKQTLLSVGARVIDIGVAATPTMYFSVLNKKADAGVQISASHNPKEYNGLKIVKRDGDKIVKISKAYKMEEVKQTVLNGKFNLPKKTGRLIVEREMLHKEIAYAKKLVNSKPARKLKIVVDAANSMGAPLASQLLADRTITLVKMNFKLDGNFPSHQPDPLQFKLLQDLQKRVVKEKADFGIAPDGDADRLFFINEKGEIIPATLVSALLANEILKKNIKARIIVDVRYTRNVQNLCAKYKAKPSLCPVGHALITAQLNRENAAFAGESSGHYYFKETGGAESSARVILHVLDILSRDKKPISQVLKKFQTSVESGECNFEIFEGKSSQELLNKIKKAYAAGTLSTLDGIAISFPTWRFSIRTSNTEPLLRLNIEGNSKKIVREKINELSKKIIEFGAKNKD